MARLKLFVPLVAFLVLAGFLFKGLSLDPKALPSALVGKPFPAFLVSELHTDRMISQRDITGEPALINVWATWCYSCRVEHPYLIDLARAGIKIIGLNYKDSPGPARQWLEDLGDPYQLVLSDINGTVGLDLGVYGAPETYVVDRHGVVQHRHVGVVDERVWQRDLASYFADVVVPSTSESTAVEGIL